LGKLGEIGNGTMMFHGYGKLPVVGNLYQHPVRDVYVS
jgi:hypothetical protein